MRTTRATFASLAATAMAAVALAMPAVSQAASPGDLCVTQYDGPSSVWDVWGNTIYTLSAGSYFRIENYGTSYGWPDAYRGHGTNRPTGFISRIAIIQSTCHQ